MITDMHPRTKELLVYLDDQRRSLSAAFEAIPPALRNRSPAPGRWSAAGVIEHLAIVESAMAARLSARILEARAQGLNSETSVDPVLPTLPLAPLLDRTTRLQASEVNLPTGLSAMAAWTALQKAGEAVRAVLEANEGLALGTVTMPHSRFGTMSLYYFFALAGAHEARHAAQLREIAQQLLSI